jgi:hypothetical protein
MGVDVSGMVAMSRLCAKIDNTAVQDGTALPSHVHLTPDGSWAIISRG